MVNLNKESAKERLRALMVVPELEVVHENVARAWYLGERFPVPKFDPKCPACDSMKALIRMYRFFMRGGQATTPYRCDVYMKCMDCGAVWTYGIVISKEMFKANEHIGLVHRKTVLAELETMDGV